MKTITRDIIIDGIVYIMEWRKPEVHDQDEVSTISITEGTTCHEYDPLHEDDESCVGCNELETYDFTEDN